MQSEEEFQEVRKAWESLHDGYDYFAERLNEWAGIPLYVSGENLVFQPRSILGDIVKAYLETHKEGDEEIVLDDGYRVANCWYSRSKQKIVAIEHRKSESAPLKVRCYVQNGWQSRMIMGLRCLGLTSIWKDAAEAKALELLRKNISPHNFRNYVLTGSFVETSERSQVTYWFRRLRPTVAIRMSEKKISVLCALCSHGVAYYDRSFAGAMTPTDDLLCHLLMMKGDEKRLWKCSIQHPPWTPEAGL